MVDIYEYIVDDVLATGVTLAASKELIEKAGGVVVSEES